MLLRHAGLALEGLAEAGAVRQTQHDRTLSESLLHPEDALPAPQPARADGIADWFLTPDQQGCLAWQRNDFGRAAELFVDPLWRGYALYRDGQSPGDSVTRTVVATVSGTSPMFLPDLLAPVAVHGVAFYPDEPALAQTDERGALGGSRTESVTLVAEGGGSGEAPAVTLDLYNLKTGAVETASIDGFVIAVDGPPAGRPTVVRDWRAAALGAVATLGMLTAMVWLLRRAAPSLGRLLAARRASRRASEAHAYAELRRALARRDNAALRPALDPWAERVEGSASRTDPRLRHALTALGANLYGTTTPRDPAEVWQVLATTIAVVRARCRAGVPDRLPLPRLNPTG